MIFNILRARYKGLLKLIPMFNNNEIIKNKIFFTSYAMLYILKLVIPELKC